MGLERMIVGLFRACAAITLFTFQKTRKAMRSDFMMFMVMMIIVEEASLVLCYMLHVSCVNWILDTTGYWILLDTSCF